jgi:hypothetical protein
MADSQRSPGEPWWRTPTGITTLVLAGATIVGAIITGVFGLVDNGSSTGPTPSSATVPSTTSISVPDASIVSASAPTNVTTSTRTSYYLVDLDYDINSRTTQTGLVTIGGRQYRKSFRNNGPCRNSDIVVPLPSGMSRVTGAVGFPDDSDYITTGVRVRVEATADQPYDSPEWTVIAELTLSTRRVELFSEALPSGVQGLRLSDDSPLCAVNVAWANPIVR